MENSPSSRMSEDSDWDLVDRIKAGDIRAFDTFGIARHALCRAAGPGTDRLRDVSFLSRELKLTDAQAAEIKALHARLATRLDECCARHCGVRARLGEALSQETNGTARTEAALMEMCRAYEESERATLDHIRRARGVLDAKQRARFDRMLTECLCRECPSCDAPPQHAEPDGHKP
ncbi:MAG: hypothetical protein FJ225_13010 [Lentisphaerae bacterium]|nr:hypothetical protein [Lentisphaerota bacterium]